MADYHVVVYDNTKRTSNIIFDKLCLYVNEANALVEEKKIEFPKPQYTVTRERY